MATGGTTTKAGIWGWAAAAGVLVFLVLLGLTSYGFWAALLLAVLVAILVAILLWIGFYRDPAADTALDPAARPQVGNVPSGTMAGTASGIAAPPNVTEAPAGDPLVENMKPEGAAEEKQPFPTPKPAATSPAKSRTGPASGKTGAHPEPGSSDDKAVPEAGAKPQLLGAAREGGGDDLKQIKGVGPKLEAELHRTGVFHFDQIAAWTEAEVAWMDANLSGVRQRVSRDDWVGQAKILASGGSTEFSERVGKGGVY